MKVHVTVSVNTTCGDTIEVDSLFYLPEGVNLSDFVKRFEVNLNGVFGKKIEELLVAEDSRVSIGFGPVPKGVLYE